jgi:hypothetical protein
MERRLEDDYPLLDDPDRLGYRRRLLFRSVNLSFGVAEDERTLQIFELGRRILTGSELEAAWKAAEERAIREAEERAAQETEARNAVEAELARLREELELLKGR